MSKWVAFYVEYLSDRTLYSCSPGSPVTTSMATVSGGWVDSGKNVKGRKWQTLVDSLGLLLKVIVSEGNAGERVLAAYALMELWEEHPEILEKVEVLWVDSGYDGDKFALAVWLMNQARVEVMHRTQPTFEVLPKRWVVERTFGWFNHYHRLSKDYERLPEMSEAAIYL